MTSPATTTARAGESSPVSVITRSVRRAVTLILGIVLGGITAPLELVVAGWTGLWRWVSRTSRSPECLRPVSILITFAGWRLALLSGRSVDGRPRGDRALGYLVVRLPLAVLGSAIVVLIGGGVVVAVAVIVAAATGGPAPAFDAEPGMVDFRTVLFLIVPGAVLLFIGVQGLIGVARLELGLWERAAGPSRSSLTQRVEELTDTRAEAVAAVDDERRRIERDLHDGVQQRVVALGLLLGRAERSDAEGARALQQQAQRDAVALLNELRDVAWRIYPAALDTLGMESALDDLAERASVPVMVSVDVPDRLDTAVRTAAYFIASEAVTNVVKHARASRITITVDHDQHWMSVRVRDDGCGGANPSGPGLLGLARRVAAVDGRFTVSSPSGGPTLIEGIFPCG